MNVQYFLLVIAVFAAGVLWFAIKTARSRARLKAKAKAKHKAVSHLHHNLHHVVHHPLLHDHARSVQPDGPEIWGRHRRHDAEETQGSYSVTARKVDFDDEDAPVESGADLSMTQITYTPTQFHEVSNRKR